MRARGGGLEPVRRRGRQAEVWIGICAVLFAATTVFAQPGEAPDPGAGSAGSGAASDPGSGSGSASDPGSGSGSASGSGAGAGSGSSTGPIIIQLPTDANAPEVNASASPTSVRLGGRFTVFISATFVDGVEVNLVEPLELGLAFEVRKKLTEDRPRADGKRTREWQLDVLAWELGDLKIAPITVTYTIGGKVGQVQTNVIRLRVDGVLGDVVDDPKLLREMRPPTDLAARDWFWLWIAAGTGGGLGLVLVALWIRSRRHQHTIRLTGGVVAAPRRIDMTGERALEALLAIESAGVLDRDDDRRAGYASMVEVIRDYLGARYRVATRDLTSSELMRRLRKVAPDEERAMIESWLDRCDVVKYGGLRASAPEAQAVLDDARALVVTTTQLQEAAKHAAKTAA